MIANISLRNHFLYAKRPDLKGENNIMSIIKIENEIIRLKGTRSFSVIGDPGCEGLGTTMMQVYANALEMASHDDFTFIVGDLVPEGTERFYKAITGLTNAIAKNDVYTLRGNHDTGEYDAHFGHHNYAIICDDFTIVVLDNAFRKFEEEGLRLLETVLAKEECQNVVIAFHIPLPNNFTCNSVSTEEFVKLKEIYTQWKNKVRYFICGHVHSRFIDTVDGIPLICTGGGGAVIEDVSDNILSTDINHHIIRFFINEHLTLDYNIVDLCKTSYVKESTDQIMSGKLTETVQNEMLAYLTYKTFSERAKSRGLKNITNLFEALAESEYRHAKNFYAILEHLKPFAKKINDFIQIEDFEYNQLYNMMRDYAKSMDMPLSRQAYTTAAYAEQTHAVLLREANDDMQKFNSNKFFVCPVCGCLMTENDITARCPLCGAPEKNYIVFSC
jgi:rubrerythrin/predicted phosphodiesterase